MGVFPTASLMLSRGGPYPSPRFLARRDDEPRVAVAGDETRSRRDARAAVVDDDARVDDDDCAGAKADTEHAVLMAMIIDENFMLMLIVLWLMLLRLLW